jgi:hypothetical protein
LLTKKVIDIYRSVVGKTPAPERKK